MMAIESEIFSRWVKGISIEVGEKMGGFFLVCFEFLL